VRILLQWRALFQKELQIQAYFRFNILHRILIGPVVNSATAGLLYTGFFERNTTLTLDGLTSENYRAALLYAFLLHTLLNSGYYFLSTKLLNEKATGTLALLWIVPVPRPVLLLGLSSVELFRALLIATFSLGLVNFLTPLPLGQWLYAYITLLAVFFFGTLLGLIRTGLEILAHGMAQFLDNFYMAFLFLACLYIPRSFFPSWAHPFIDINPISYAFRGLVEGGSLKDLVFLLASLVLLMFLVNFLFAWKEKRLRELSFG
jgi:ABC-type multidrug transport system permease subunit